VMCHPVGSAKFKRVMMNHAWYAAKSLHDAGLPVVPVAPDADYSSGKTLAQHNDFARDHKDCPAFYRDSGLWVQFCEYVQAFYASMAAPSPGPVPPADDRIMVEGNPFGPWGYRLGFKGRLQQIGAAVSPSDVQGGILAWMGWPKADEYTGTDGCSYQACERGWLQWVPNTASPYDIVRMRDEDDPAPPKGMQP
jgi:hypothetical protein